MKANFIVSFANGAPVLPPFSDDDGGTQLHYLVEGVLTGGYATVSYTPADTCIVQVNASEAAIAAMKTDGDYVWLEDIPDAD